MAQRARRRVKSHQVGTPLAQWSGDNPDLPPNDHSPDLVKDATTQASTLIRSEVELAKTEISSSAKKAGLAIGMFGAAAVVLAYSSFFFFFFLAELLDNWMPRWVAFLVVFLIMFVLVAILALVGVKFIKGVEKPQATIDSVGELKSVVPGNKTAEQDSGMFT